MSASADANRATVPPRFPLPRKPIVVMSVQSSLPVPGHAPRGSWHRLVERMVAGRGKLGTVPELLRRVIPEPLLARLIALDDRMPCVSGMVACVLRWG